MAKEEHLNDILGVKRGSVNPFAVLNDSGKKIAKVILDKHLENDEYLSFHPMSNEQTVEIKLDDFARFLQFDSRKLEIAVLEDQDAEKQEKPQKIEKK